MLATIYTFVWKVLILLVPVIPSVYSACLTLRALTMALTCLWLPLCCFIFASNSALSLASSCLCCSLLFYSVWIWMMALFYAALIIWSASTSWKSSSFLLYEFLAKEKPSFSLVELNVSQKDWSPTILSRICLMLTCPILV